MSRRGSMGPWLALGLLAAIAGCGGSSSDRAPSVPPLPTAAPHISFYHPVSGRPLPSGASYELPDSVRPGSFLRFVLPAAESEPDRVPITYALEQPLPRGLGFSPTSRTLSGTLDPREMHPGLYRLHYRASAPGHREAHLSIILYLPPTLRASGSTVYAFPVGHRTRKVMPAATGGRPPYTYALIGCSTATWLRIEGNALLGSPTAANQHERRRNCVWRVTDSTGGVDSVSVEVSVGSGPRPQLYFPDADGTPLADGAPLPPLGTLGTLAQGEAVPSFPSFPPALGERPGTRISYSLEVASGPPGVHKPPEGLVLDQASRTLGGTIEDSRWPAGTYRLYYVASAIGHLPARLGVSFDLEDPLRLRHDESSRNPIEFQTGKFTRRPLPTAAGGTPPYRYALEQCPLDWLRLAGSELAANPQLKDEGETQLCRYRVTDAEGAFADLVLVVPATPLPITVFQFENRHIVDRDLPVGSAIEKIVLPRALNGVGNVTYELSPVLPDGLSFHQPAGPSGRPEIRGTPNSLSLLTRYCLHASDTSGATAAPRCFHLRTVGHEVPRFTVNLEREQQFLLYSRLIRSTEQTPSIAINSTAPSPLRDISIQMPVAFLPPSWNGNATYSIVPELAPFSFVSTTRLLTSPAPHPTPTPVVYTYGVRREVDDALFAAAICFEIGRREVERTETLADDSVRVWREYWLALTFHDEAVRSSTGEYLCHPNPRGDDDPASGSTGQSNPVHDALGMVHARRAVTLAHDVIGEWVRNPAPGGTGAVFHSSVDFAGLWGRSGGFSWSGTGESLLAGGDIVRPGGALQLGLVAGFHRTTLDYRAEARHLEGLYSEGEHLSELYSAHPFAAWHSITGSVIWGSVGAGAGSLSFKDEAPPFDERRRSDLTLGSAALGIRHPLPSTWLGTFSFSGLAEHIALRIEGDEAARGIRPRSLRGSDLAVGLDWRRLTADDERFPVPSLSLGFRRQTGDGAADSLVNIAGSLTYRPASKALSFDVAASTLLGIAGNDSGAWDVHASAGFDPTPGPRGLSLSLRSALGASSDEGEAALGIDAEFAYGVFGGVFGSTVRPYVGVSGFTGGASGARRSTGLHLRDEPDYRLSLETFEHTGTDTVGLEVRLRRIWP